MKVVKIQFSQLILCKIDGKIQWAGETQKWDISQVNNGQITIVKNF